MATEIILPALGMAQETGKIVRWLKAAGEQVNKGEPIAEIETDKATVELEAPATGLLTITAAEGDDVPVGQVIALIQDARERERATQPQPADVTAAVQASTSTAPSPIAAPTTVESNGNRRNGTSVVQTTSLATRIATEYNVDLSLVTPQGKDQRIKMSDVVAYVQRTQESQGQQSAKTVAPVLRTSETRLPMASPKARRLAKEQGKDLSTIRGTGPAGAILAADIIGATFMTPTASTVHTNSVDATPMTPTTRATPTVGTSFITPTTNTVGATPMTPTDNTVEPNTVWRIMAERTTQSWTSTPHFMLTREVNVTRLIAWRTHLLKRSKGDNESKVTYTDLLVKAVALILRDHPRLNASWSAGKITLHPQINVGIAVASDDGLIVPIIHNADTLSIAEIAQRRKDVATRTQAGKIRPEDLANGTFTISNLGMYGVDAFNAIINAPQVAILAVGRIVERVVPVAGQPQVQPMMTLTLSCDHRVIDGARGAQFLRALAEVIEEPLGLLS